MDLRELEYFVAVADWGSFSKAARVLHVVQSGVSVTIRKLEAELGAELFDRSSQPVSLTEAGTVFSPVARATLQAAREAKEAVAASFDKIAGPLTIGMMTSVTFVDLPQALAQLGELHPDVEVRLRTSPGGSQGLVESLVNRELDAAFLAVPGPTPAGLNTVEIARRNLHLVVTPDHPLAAKDSVAIEHLAELRFVDSPVGYGNRTLVDDVFAAAHVRRNVALEVPDIGTAADYIRLGLGVGFLSDDLVPAAYGLVTVRVDHVNLVWRLLIATPAGKKPSRALQAFLKVLGLFPEGDQGSRRDLLPR
jgi:DNA-binding transcriptional LysR family regulator